MGRLIDVDEVDDAIYKCFEGIQFYDGTGYDIYSDSKECIDKIPTVEAIPKADYEKRLKADLKAILVELQLEIREYHEIGCDEDCNNCRMVGCVEPVNVIKDLDIIQQKINELKGDQEGEE